MSTDPGYMLIRVDLQGAQQAAAEATVVKNAIGGVGTAAATSSAQTASSATKSQKAQSMMKRGWGTAMKAIRLGALGAAGAIAGVTFAGIKSVQKMKDLALVAAGLRRNLDLTAETGSRWAALASARGIAPTSLNMAFKTLSQNLTMAHKEGGTYQENLEMIGITQEDINKGVKDFDGFLETVATRFGEMEGSAKRQTAAAKLLGRGYQTVLPIFADGAKGMEEQLKWADKYHVTMGDQMVDDYVKLAMAERESKVATVGLQNELGRMFLPILRDAHEEYQDFVATVTDPKLSKDQKIDVITQKIKSLTKRASKVIIQIIPGMVEQAAENAPKIAAAFVKGFLQADMWGKLIVGAWLATKLLKLKPVAKLAGASIGRAFAIGIITLGLIEFGPMIFEWAKKQGEKFKEIGYDLGYKIGSEIVKAVNFIIDEIINRVPFVQIDRITPGLYQPPTQFNDDGTLNQGGIDAATAQNFGITPADIPDDSGGGRGGGQRGGGGGDKSDKGGTEVIQLHVDGKKMAEVVRNRAETARARR